MLIMMKKKVNENFNKHNVQSSLLIGELKKEDIVKERKWKRMCLI